MAIDGTNFVLVDNQTGILLGADSTVIVPDVQGAAGYDIWYDADAAIEYADAQGVALDNPDAEGIATSELDQEPRGYLAIDADTGYVCDAENLRLVPYAGDELTAAEGLELAKTGEVPVVSPAILDAEGLPFESVNA